MARFIIPALALAALAPLALAAAAVAAPSFPPVGARVSFFPSTNPAIGLRHCDYVCSATPIENSEDPRFQRNIIYFIVIVSRRPVFLFLSLTYYFKHF